MENVINNLDNIITLIKTVSESSLTSFHYEEGGNSLSMEIRREASAPVGDPAGDKAAVRTEGREEDTAASDYILSPMVGTFYASRSEGGEPLVSQGDSVKAGQAVGIVEAMKLMNEIEAAFDGVVEEILVENGQMIEYGQPLMKIRRG